MLSALGLCTQLFLSGSAPDDRPDDRKMTEECDKFLFLFWDRNELLLLRSLGLFLGCFITGMWTEYYATVSALPFYDQEKLKPLGLT